MPTSFARRVKNGITTALITGDGTVDGREVVLCATSFDFLGGSFCMSTGEKVWRAAKIAIEKRRPLITIVTDPTLGSVAIGFGSRGIRIFEHNAGDIGFSGKRVIKQYTGKKPRKSSRAARGSSRKGSSIWSPTHSN